MSYVWTFLEGLASFVSPCTLPLMPVFAAYFAGDRGKGGFAKAVAFVAGFTVVFMTLGFFAGSVGGFLAAHRTAVSVGSGLIVILFGLAFLDVIQLPGFKGSAGMADNRGVFGAFIFGLLYSVNLTPCVGAFLAAALATAAESGKALEGAALLGAYSAGLGIPFIAAGVALSGLNGLFKKIKSSYNILIPVCGAALILFGAWMVAKPWIKVGSGRVGVGSGRVGVGSGSGRVGVGSGSGRVGVGSGSGRMGISETKKENVMEITSKEMFDTEVLKSEKPVIVDFWAPWCGPCRAMGPVLEEIAAERADLRVCKVNVDEFGDIAAKYGITSIPCVFCIRNGEVAAKSVGLTGKQELLNTLGL